MITVEHLTKRYGQTLAVDDLSFTIEDGHIYGFLGPNGAGKSTTLNIMTGCLSATNGSVKIDGLDIFDDGKKAKKKIGYLPEIPPVYPEQTPREYLTFVAEAKGIRKADRTAEIDRVIAETHIEDVANKLIRHLSKGYRQRVGIAQALLGSPETVILDEPTVGLDPAQIIEIRDLIKSLGEKHTVILSSHILPEVQAICEKVLIIYRGKLVAFDTPETLAKTLAGSTTVQLRTDASADELTAALDGVEGLENLETSVEEGGTVSAKAAITAEDTDSVLKSIFNRIAAMDKVLYQLTPVKATLEDVFMELTEDTAAAEGTDENAAAAETAEEASAARPEGESENMEDAVRAASSEGSVDAE